MKKTVLILWHNLAQLSLVSSIHHKRIDTYLTFVSLGTVNVDKTKGQNYENHAFCELPHCKSSIWLDKRLVLEFLRQQDQK